MLLTIRLIHINDSHSALDRAGRVQTIVETARRVDPSALLLHAGDALVGTPWYEAGGRGQLDMQFIEALRPDGYAIGNHDLDAGLDHFRELVRLRRIPLVAANWQIQGPLRHRVKPYRLRTVQGRRVAIVGLSVDPKAYGLADDRIVYRDPAMVLEEQLHDLKRDVNPAAILVLSHLGQAADERLAGYFPRVAAVVGGHSHTVTAVPERFYHPDHRPSVVVQAGANFAYVGLLELDILDGKVANAQGSLLRVRDDIPSEPDVEAMLDTCRADVAAFDQVVAEAKGAIPLVTRAATDSPLGSLAADWLRAAAAEYLGERVHVALLNHTGLRRGLARGPITRRDLYEVYPFDNTLMITTLRGVQLLAMLDHAAARGGDPISGAAFAIAGGKATAARVGGKAVQPRRAYLVASNSYLIRHGGSGYKVLTQGSHTVDTNRGVRAILEAAIRDAGEVERPEGDPRIRRQQLGLEDEVRARWGISPAAQPEAGWPFGCP